MTSALKSASKAMQATNRHMDTKATAKLIRDFQVESEKVIFIV